VAVFPEGTTSCGLFPTHRRRLRPAFFQAAIDAGVPVHPVRLVYRRRADDSSGPGAVTATPAFLGSDSVLASLWRIATAPGLVVEVTCLSPVGTADRDRGELATRCQRLIGDRYRP
jgi:1-acyl-sn-glycerol-3-phosphate acyltransferase